MKFIKKAISKESKISVQHRLYLSQVGKALSIPVKVLQTINNEDLRSWIIDKLLSFKVTDELPDNSCFGLFLAFDSKAKACKECIANRLCQKEILIRRKFSLEMAQLAASQK